MSFKYKLCQLNLLTMFSNLSPIFYIFTQKDII